MQQSEIICNLTGMKPHPLTNINTNDGYSKNIIDSIVNHRLIQRSHNTEEAHKKRVDSAKKTLDNCKTVTAGVFFGASVVHLGTDVLSKVVTLRKQKEKLEKEKLIPN